MQALKEFIKQETVLVIAMILAIVSMFFVAPDSGYAGYIDYQTLALLFCLMIIMCKLQKMGVFHTIGVKLLQKVNGSRQLYAALVLLCFFSSMLITNDVALITFVPFAITVLKMAGLEHRMIPVVVLQTVAANLGSMVTPIGNPQNLYLYGQSGMSLGSFIMLMLPYAAIAAVIFALMIMRMKNQNVDTTALQTMDAPKINVDRDLIIYMALFLGCVLAVAKILPWQAMLIVVGAVTVKNDASILKNVDYSLLLTFVAFFVFSGNMSRIDAVRDLFSMLLEKSTLIFSVLSCQIISNVPTAILLSQFTNNYHELLIGVNIGGVGTIIASLASLITLREFQKHYPKKIKSYFVEFSGINFAFLFILTLSALFY